LKIEAIDCEARRFLFLYLFFYELTIHLTHSAHGSIPYLAHALTLKPHVGSYLGHSKMFLTYAKICSYNLTLTTLQAS
jgi:hypothetical protein